MTDIVLCASGSDEVRIVHDLARGAAGVPAAEELRVVRRCADLAETLAVTAAGIGDVVLIDLGVRGLDRDVLLTMLRAGAVVGLRDPGDQDRTEYGLRHVVSPKAPVEEIVSTIVAALGGQEDEAETWVQEPQAAADGAHGHLTVVWGPVGSPGRSTIAANLAAESARHGTQTVLVDADTYGPSLSQMLGVLDESPGVVAACRAHDRDTLTDDALSALLPTVLPGLRLLSGIGVPGRWAEVHGHSLDGVWEALARRGELVVADVAGPLEEDEELSYDTAAPQRNAAALSAVRRADTLIAVVDADPVSITRLLRETTRLEDLGAGPLHVIVNRMGSAVGDQQVRELLHSRLPVASIHLLPQDTAACRAAAWDGEVLAETAPRSPLRRALHDLAATSEIVGERTEEVPTQPAADGPSSPRARWRELVAARIPGRRSPEGDAAQ